ncbi:AraC-type DNA-binding domain-containing protein [gamma proteobacterium HTCC5015]|nr:AraC-type DNA-binding domain-containing protein [gamma proteobacterium HTCC5015]
MFIVTECAEESILTIGKARQADWQQTTDGRGSLSCAYVRGLAEYLEQSGIDVADFWQHFGFDPASMDDQTQRLPIAQYDAMLSEAGKRAKDAAVGLHVGEHIKPGQYGVLGYVVMSCKTGREVFERHMRYENLVSDRAVSTYHIEDDRVRLTWSMNGVKPSRAMAEENVASWITYARWIGAKQLSPIQVRFCHSEPPYVEEYQRLFDCSLAFDCECTEVIFPLDYLDMPVVQHDPVMLDMMDAYAERLLSEFGQREGVLGDVRRHLTELLPKGEATLEAVASEMACSPRTLQRRLSEADSNFQSVLDDTRKDLAQHYIGQPFIDPIEIAFLLGFADQSTFYRAFKRWMGMTPGQYRERN